MIEFLSTKSCHVLLANIHDIMTTEKFQSAEAFRALCSAFIKVLGQGATCKTQTFQVRRISGLMYFVALASTY